MKWTEEFSCGCTHSTRKKRDLVGYCARHGNDVRNLYKEWRGTMVLIERIGQPHPTEERHEPR